MKTLILTLAILLFTGLTNTTAQNNIKNIENEKVVTHVIGSHYEMIMFSSTGEILQEGNYFKEGDRFLEHGIWKLYDQYCDFGSNQHIFEDNEIKNSTPVSHGKEF